MARLAKVGSLHAHPVLSVDDVLPHLSPAEYESLKESIAKNGVQQPILVGLPENVIIEGHHRWRAATELGLAEIPVVTEETRSDEERILLGIALNGARRHWNNEQKRKLITFLLKRNALQSDRTIAVTVGASHSTVGEIRSELVRTGEVVAATSSSGRDGKKRPRSTTPRMPRERKPSAPKPVVVERVAEERAPVARLERSSVIDEPEAREKDSYESYAAPQVETWKPSEERRPEPEMTGTSGDVTPPSSDEPSQDERLSYLTVAESNLAQAASFRGLGQAAVNEALDIVRGLIELLRKRAA